MVVLTLNLSSTAAEVSLTFTSQEDTVHAPPLILTTFWLLTPSINLLNKTVDVIGQKL